MRTARRRSSSERHPSTSWAGRSSASGSSARPTGRGSRRRARRFSDLRTPGPRTRSRTTSGSPPRRSGTARATRSDGSSSSRTSPSSNASRERSVSRTSSPLSASLRPESRTKFAFLLPRVARAAVDGDRRHRVAPPLLNPGGFPPVRAPEGARRRAGRCPRRPRRRPHAARARRRGLFAPPPREGIRSALGRRSGGPGPAPADLLERLAQRPGRDARGRHAHRLGAPSGRVLERVVHRRRPRDDGQRAGPPLHALRAQLSRRHRPRPRDRLPYRRGARRHDPRRHVTGVRHDRLDFASPGRSGASSRRTRAHHDGGLMTAEQGPHLLVIDDEAGIREMLTILFQKDGYRVTSARGCVEGLAALDAMAPDLVMTDLKMPDGTGLDVLARVRESNCDTPVIMITAYSSTKTAVEALKAGAYDYIAKPFDVEELKHVVARALEKKRLVEENVALKERTEGRSAAGVVGISRKMRALFDLISRIGKTTSTVLINGESGTGKELIARAIHQASARAARPFISINCGAMPENLLESELFGHERGAFTGAVKEKKGLFSEAEGGTLFLDEIGETSVTMQVKLLRALQERVVRRVGGNTEEPIDVRIICATNKDLQK